MREIGEDVHELARLLFRAAEAVRAPFEALCERFEMTPVQARALLVLDEPLPMRDMAAVLRCDPSNVTGIADRLEQRGLVRREPDAADRRVKLLAATAAGHKLRREFDAALGDLSPLTARLSARERQVLSRLLLKLAGNGDCAEGDR